MKRIGIVGGGQLGRMMTQSALELGLAVTVVDPMPHCPAAQVGAEQIVGDYDDEAAIRQLAKVADFMTFEIELAHAEALERLSKALTINPSPQTLALIKDKLGQKQYLTKQRIPVADYREVNSAAEIAAAATDFGYPLILKARFDSYDGRGNAVIKNEAGISVGLKKLAGRQLYVERYIPFTKELAVMVARGADGTVVTYPVVETIHARNICEQVIAPAPVAPAIAKRATGFARRVAERFAGAGVFGIELFLTKDGTVLVNEIAPRAHNSGHYTIEACQVSQFEQHIRVVTGLPLGDPGMTVPAAVMINILGERDGPAEPQGLERALAIPGVSVHLYGKTETRLDRKMGHLTAVAKTPAAALKAARAARRCITI